MKSKLLLLVQSHAHADALMDCIPFIRENVSDLWIVFSPVVLVDAEQVNREYDKQIADIEQAMDAAYARRDGAGGDAYKLKYDAAILEKASKVKTAWKDLTPGAQEAATKRVFDAFFNARPCPSIEITQHSDHFEVSSHVELQNGLKGTMRPGFEGGNYMIAWPTSIAGPRNTSAPAPVAPKVEIPIPVKAPVATIKKEMDARLRDLLSMNIDDLGKLALPLGINPSGMHRLKIAHAVHKAEKALVAA